MALAVVLGVPDLQGVRARVASTGAWGPAIFVLSYGVMTLIPWPRAFLTVAGGALFGLWAGAGLSLAGALLGATTAFGIGRYLGRPALERVAPGRLAHFDTLLQDHGLVTVIALRLAPVIPFLVINYAGGLSSLRFRHFVVGSAIGMVPGSVAYAAVGASGTKPWGLLGAASALAFLTAAGAWQTRRRQTTGANTSCDA